MKKSRLILILCVISLFGGIFCFRSIKTATIPAQNAVSDIREKEYIKWVEFNVTCEAMKKACQYDLDTYGEKIHLNWVTLLAYLGAKYGGDFTRYKEKDMEEIAELLQNGDKTEEKLAQEMKYYSYYREAYGAVLDGMVGEYEMEYPIAADSGEMEEDTAQNEEASEKNVDEAAEKGANQNIDAAAGADSEMSTVESDGVNSGVVSTEWKKVYGLKAYHPIAKGFPYSDYDDFGVSRSYGYRRNHLGHDMMGQVGTPVIAVESGYVAELGWNQYGGWRIGINSFDGKRYYYYAHLRQNRPYAEGLNKGDIVQAGDVIGYMGRTGYSTQENVNNIDEYHLHFGLQLIFDESQREGNNQIWVNGYELVKFLYQHQSEVQRNDETKEWTRIYRIQDPTAKAGEEQIGKQL